MARTTGTVHSLRALFDGREFVLGKGSTLMGSGQACAVRVRDAQVDARHALIVAQPEGAWLEDLGSTVGTYLNGRRITVRTRLADGDRIGLGCHEFQYAAKSVVDTPNDAHLTGLATGTHPHGRLQPRWGLKFGRLTVLTGPARGRGFDIIKPQVTAGRARDYPPRRTWF